MPRVCVKPTDRLTVSGDAVIQIDRICGGCAHLTVDASDGISVSRGESQWPAKDEPGDLSDIAEEVLSRFSETDAAASQEMLTKFVSDLFYALAQKRQKEERHKRQAEGIAAAKAKGVRFGPSRKPLPENFMECYEAWRSGQMSMTQAAETCGMIRESFRRAIIRVEESGDCSA